MQAVSTKRLKLMDELDDNDSDTAVISSLRLHNYAPLNEKPSDVERADLIIYWKKGKCTASASIDRTCLTVVRHLCLAKPCFRLQECLDLYVTGMLGSLCPSILFSTTHTFDKMIFVRDNGELNKRP